MRCDAHARASLRSPARADDPAFRPVARARPAFASSSCRRLPHLYPVPICVGAMSAVMLTPLTASTLEHAASGACAALYRADERYSAEIEERRLRLRPRMTVLGLARKLVLLKHTSRYANALLVYA